MRIIRTILLLTRGPARDTHQEPMLPLALRQQECLDLIKEYKRTHGGNSPIAKELAESMLVSVAMVQKILMVLELKGYIKRTPNVQRSIEVVNTNGETATTDTMGHEKSG